MKDDDDMLKPFIIRVRKTNSNKMNFIQRNHEEGCGLHIAYNAMMARHGLHICAIQTSGKSNFNHLI